MVRHEAAEALGGIATDECFPILQEFAKRMDVPRVVRESCEVALDMVSSLSLTYSKEKELSLMLKSEVFEKQYEYERSNEFVPLPTAHSTAVEA
jgi:deoxyhypusine monooxygenase